MKNNFDSVIFDLDGTLTYTFPEYRYNLISKTLKELGKKAKKEDVDAFWFLGDREKVIKERFNVDIGEFKKSYRRNIPPPEELKKSILLYQDINFILELKKEGYKLGVVTGAPPVVANFELSLFNENLFDAFVIAHRLNNIEPKPNPQGIELCVNLLFSNKKKTLYVGNADEDIYAAKNAGVFDVLIDRKEYKFDNINPSLTIESIYELKEFLGF